MHAPKLEMAITLVGVVELVGIGNLGQERAGVLGQRVEEDSVDDDADGLWTTGALATATMKMVEASR